MRYLIIIALITTLTACGGGGDECTSKDYKIQSIQPNGSAIWYRCHSFSCPDMTPQTTCKVDL
jgi:hypothetical protein